MEEFNKTKLQDLSARVKNKKLYFIDLDGTIYLGNNIIPGAGEFIRKLTEWGIGYFFLSNNSSKSKRDYVSKLESLQIPASESNIILSTDGVIAYLNDLGIKDIYLVGTESMKEQFVPYGFRFGVENAKCVVLGFDKEITYQKIKDAAMLLRKGVPFLATHPDLVCPTPEGPIPDIGSMIEMFRAATGVSPKIFGKPNKEMIEHIIQQRNLPRGEIAMIGDRLYTDRKLAQNAGIDFICVLSGETTAAEAGSIEDMIAVKSVADLIDLL